MPLHVTWTCLPPPKYISTNFGGSHLSLCSVEKKQTEAIFTVTCPKLYGCPQKNNLTIYTRKNLKMKKCPTHRKIGKSSISNDIRQNTDNYLEKFGLKKFPKMYQTCWSFQGLQTWTSLCMCVCVFLQELWFPLTV